MLVIAPNVSSLTLGGIHVNEDYAIIILKILKIEYKFEHTRSIKNE